MKMIFFLDFFLFLMSNNLKLLKILKINLKLFLILAH